MKFLDMPAAAERCRKQISGGKNFVISKFFDYVQGCHCIHNFFKKMVLNVQDKESSFVLGLQKSILLQSRLYPIAYFASNVAQIMTST